MNNAKKWYCMSQCGACCKLSPDIRQEAISELTNDQQKVYMSMVGRDGWCIYYDKVQKECTIYNKRPDFCNVSNIGLIFNVPNDQIDDFAIKCCKQHIKALYGVRSKEIKRYTRTTS